MPGKINYERMLNPAQLSAVMANEGPLLVIAGAGSGKTRTLVYRVARLVEKGVSPQNILLLTFTRKAAGEMLERASGLADERCKNVSGGTFHSLAHRVLRAHADSLGFSREFTVLDRSDMEELLQSLAREMHVERKSIRFPNRSTLANILSKAANLQKDVKSLVKSEYEHFLEYVPQITTLAQLYVNYKRENQLMDYDDLILFLRDLLAQSEEVRERLSRQYRYIMVDEYQDTNAIQAEIVKWLGHTHQNVMVVGDDSQSIYSFRGANYKNMFDFPRLFPQVKIIKLEENYRSTQPILNFTNALMDQALEKYTKCLFTRRGDGEVPRVVDTRTEPEQAMFVCRFIKDQLQQGRSIRDFAVLFRAAYHSFELELELAREGIPFVKYGGFKFAESAHIKDLLAHLRVVVNKGDTVSWGRILRLVKNIGQRKSQAIIQWLKQEKAAPWEVAQWPGAAKGDDGLKRLSGLLGVVSTQGLAPEKAVKAAIDYYEPILKNKFDDFPRREKDLEQLALIASRYKKLRPFLDDLILEPPTSVADIDPRFGADRLTLSTVHSAKGLEWPVVFIIWAMDGYFPSTRANSSVHDIEEERRLMYVAATRAKDQLIICYPGEEVPRVWHMAREGGLCSFIRALPQGVTVHDSRGYVPPRKEAGWRVNAEAVQHYYKNRTPTGLRLGDRVRHPAFGDGVISSIAGGEKVEVLFRDFGRKLLHLGYTSLEKV
ncbi:MAG: UvrD-helicase domain-containing protein [Deltaproteobacteria bacterium]|nr:UvrD-helicase domain-containing protein [Deltaproteobacteria bacterium]MBW1977245.1 UvrD-helicase domain-containing protein [Deltaproteobacteria bacterium]MBW2044988.1 UvrD-helicase domain-containing protein [Deltaproteobacteria bacterium]MBW2300996.1 UvrD-helicase domain-containing protein [Deltaproteobacteria bacterium]